MSLVDDVTITIRAGNGGNGSKAFLTVPGSVKLYPDGGSGGRGGNVYFVGSNNVSDLSEFRYRKKFEAEDGVSGGKKNLTGRNGKDLTILVPQGTTIFDNTTGRRVEILKLNKPAILAKGGEGGIGNHDQKGNLLHASFEGQRGEEFVLHLTLNLIANVGLVGFPNAGKSSLLNALTNAQAKVGDYTFTTLEPNLGAMGNSIIADIPGVIQGASQGKGLGITFLKHIQKTTVLVHCIDSSTPDVLTRYQELIREFEKFSPTLLEKKEIVLLTKIDLIEQKTLREKMNQLTQLGKKVLAVSTIDDKSISELKHFLENELAKHEKSS